MFKVNYSVKAHRAMTLDFFLLEDITISHFLLCVLRLYDFLVSQLYWSSWIFISLMCLNFAVEACSSLEKLNCLIILVKQFLQSSYVTNCNCTLSIFWKWEIHENTVCTTVMLPLFVCIQSEKLKPFLHTYGLVWPFLITALECELRCISLCIRITLSRIASSVLHLTKVA